MAHKKDISLSFASLLLVVCMALPAVMKLSHAIHGHRNQQCNVDIALHLHEAEFDCDFQKFKLSQQFYKAPRHFEFQTPSASEEINDDYYFFLGTYQNLHFSLRGPPQFS